MTLTFRGTAIAFVLIPSSILSSGFSAAQEISKEDIVRTFERKASLLDGCRVTFGKTRSAVRTDGTSRETFERETHVFSQGGMRIETMGVDSGGALVPKAVSSDDGQELRIQSFDEDSTPNQGIIRHSPEPVARMAGLADGPLGHSGLLLAPAFGLRQEKDRPPAQQWYDAVSIAAHPDSVIRSGVQTAPNGEPAILVENDPGGDRRRVFRLWLSTERNLAVLQCDWIDIDNGKETIKIRVENADFTEATEGLYLPRKTVHAIFGAPRGFTSTTVVCSDIEYEMNLNLDGDAFRVTFPDGVRVEDEIAGSEYVVGESASLESQLNETVGKIQTTIEKTHEMDRLADPSEDLIEQPLPPKRVSRKFLYGIACATIVMFPFGFWLGRLSAAKGAKREIEEGVNR